MDDVLCGGHQLKTKVLWIEDDRYFLRPLLPAFVALSCDVQSGTLRKFWKILNNNLNDYDGIVLDRMMDSPSDWARKSQSNNGLDTGLILALEIRERSEIPIIICSQHQGNKEERIICKKRKIIYMKKSDMDADLIVDAENNRF